jgi:prephenate dehydratase
MALFLLEDPLRIAFQGEPGAYSEAAAVKLRPGAVGVPCPSFELVFDAVKRGEAGCGILPIENSVTGSIHRHYDLLLEHDLPIVGEVELKVEHALLALPGVRLEEIRRIYSHPQALAQCERFLHGLTGTEVVASYDTAGSAKMILDGNLRDAAAIASRRAAEVCHLAILREGVQDYETNITRFLLLARTPTPIGPPDKTTIVFSLRDQPGALYKALSVFALRDIDLAKLESRPIPGRPWDYLFYADLNIDRADLRCARALVHLAEFAGSLTTLGSYPRWKAPESAS